MPTPEERAIAQETTRLQRIRAARAQLSSDYDIKRTRLDDEIDTLAHHRNHARLHRHRRVPAEVADARQDVGGNLGSERFEIGRVLHAGARGYPSPEPPASSATPGAMCGRDRALTAGPPRTFA